MNFLVNHQNEQPTLKTRAASRKGHGAAEGLAGRLCEAGEQSAAQAHPEQAVWKASCYLQPEFRQRQDFKEQKNVGHHWEFCSITVAHRNQALTSAEKRLAIARFTRPFPLASQFCLLLNMEELWQWNGTP